MRTILMLCLLGLATFAHAAEPPIGWRETRRIRAPEANQAAAEDSGAYYAVTNDKVAKYNGMGELVATSTGSAKHLNSAFLFEGNLLCAHSNYPTVPEQSEIKLLDTTTMQLSTFHDFGNFGGSLTWCVLRENHWWCNFAKYGEKNAETFLVKFDRQWKEVGRWTYPESVIKQLHRMSLSGGIWYQHQLLVTGHDDGVFFVLDLPVKGTVLEHVRTVKMPFTGQGFAIDWTGRGLIGIDRAKRELVWADLNPSQPLRMRVMSYNIHHGQGTDGKIDLERIARTIRSIEPDLVALQEVDDDVPRSNRISQIDELRNHTDMSGTFIGCISLNGGDYGNAMLGRWLGENVGHSEDLPNLDKGEKRCLNNKEVQPTKKHQPFYFLYTHFDHRPKEDSRLASAKFINKWVKEHGDTPMILAGDFNSVPDSETQKELLKTWTRTNKEPLPTVPVEKPSHQIDYIFVKPANRFRIIKTEVLPEAVASDHRAIWAEVELLPEVSTKADPSMK
jgi:endonuclease/exonuclease/phosphatase family metal-dependent hydrolase